MMLSKARKIKSNMAAVKLVGGVIVFSFTSANFYHKKYWHACYCTTCICVCFSLVFSKCSNHNSTCFVN